MMDKNNALVRSLVDEAQGGSEDALSQIISMYEPLISSLLAKYSGPDISNEDREDLRQESLIVFCNAVKKYDLSQNEVDFGLFAKICMERGILSQLRVIKRRPLIEPMSDGNSFESSDDPSTDIIESESIRDIWRLIDENLSEYENKVWNLRMSGLSSAEIAEQLQCEVKSINNALYRIRAKLRKALEKQYH